MTTRRDGLAFPGENGHRLHVVETGPNYWEVWLDTELEDFDGICLAQGSTQASAVGRAVMLLDAAADFLRRRDPDGFDAAVPPDKAEAI